MTNTERYLEESQAGEVFVSREFVAFIAEEGATEFGVEFQGRVPLAKNAGERPLWRLERATPVARRL